MGPVGRSASELVVRQACALLRPSVPRLHRKTRRLPLGALLGGGSGRQAEARGGRQRVGRGPAAAATLVHQRTQEATKRLRDGLGLLEEALNRLENSFER